MTAAQRMMTAEVPLGDVSPRFQPGPAGDGPDNAISVRRRAWFSIQPVLSRRLQPLLDDGWEVVPSSLGPHSLRISVQLERRPGLLSFLERLSPNNKRYVSSATVLLQRPVHWHE